MKFLDRLLKKLATVIEIILIDVVAVSGRNGNAEVVYRVFFRCRVLLNCAYSVTSSRFSSSGSAVALRRAFVRALGAGSGKKTLIGTPKNPARFSIGDRGLVGCSLPAGDRVGGSDHRLCQLLLADALTFGMCAVSSVFERFVIEDWPGGPAPILFSCRTAAFSLDERERGGGDSTCGRRSDLGSCASGSNRSYIPERTPRREPHRVLDPTGIAERSRRGACAQHGATRGGGSARPEALPKTSI
jgi:hypothetical protein